MKKFIVFWLFLVLLFTFCACTSQDAPDNQNPTGDNGSSETPGNGESDENTNGSENSGEGSGDSDECEHDYTLCIDTPAKALVDGSGRNICFLCGDEKEIVIPATKTLKVLAVGNSFSVDTMEYLWDICDDGGVETIILGNLYIGGCDLDRHWRNIQNDAADYTYYKNTQGSWSQKKSTALSYALADEEWDIITVQQSSKTCGLPESFENIDNIVNYLKANSTNAEVEILWHMTWAYQQNSTHSAFPNYDSDQATMYQAIINTIRSKILTKNSIAGVIPAGTAIQNLRTSYLGDTLTRDGYHLSYSFGRYTGALTWYAYLTGGSIDDIDWVPPAHSDLEGHMDAIKEAVSNAISKPLMFTQSENTTAPIVKQKTDEEQMALLGLDINNYKLLEFDFTVGAYWNCNREATLLDSAGNSKYFIALELLDKTELPVGSVIIIDKGFRYRPDAWLNVEGTELPASRPPLCYDTVLHVSAEWWGNFAVRGLNLAYENGKTVMTAEDIQHIRIYVPNN